MRKLHKGLLIGGITLAALVPAGLVAADQIDKGNGHGRGNGSMDHDCTGDQAQDRIQARDGTGPNHVANSTAAGNTGNGPQDHTRPMDGTGNQFRSGR